MAVTRKEQIASGKKVTPLTREELRLAGKTFAPLTEEERFHKVAYSGGGSGGGESGDFSIANVAITVSDLFAQNGLSVSFPVVVEDGEYSGLNSSPFFPRGLSETIVVPMWKGKAFAVLQDEANVATTGGVAFDSDAMEFTITGDGTITITPAG